MRTRLSPLAVILTAALIPALPCPAAAAPGVAHLAATAGDERPLSLSIWYPSGAPATGQVGGTAVFEGTEAALDAQSPDGAHPLVLLSHGGLRSAPDTGAWLAAALAEAGMLVAEINAPRPETAGAAMNEIWQRPRDIRRALDLILQDPAWAGRVDPGRIAVVGFALGGTAALSVSGAVLDADAYARACDGPPRAEAPDCAWMGAEGASLGHLDRSRVAQAGRDPRIAAAVALEPDYRSAFRAPAGVAGVPTLFLSLGEPQPVSPGLPQAESAALPGATDSDAFPACTAAGPRILSAEGGDPALCGASRAARDAAHGAIADRIRAFIARRAGW